MLRINKSRFALAGMGVVVVAVGVMAFGSERRSNRSSKAKDPDCLGELAAEGSVAKKQFPITFDGRLSIGDLDWDGSPDIVVSNRDKLAAYNLCGNTLWQVQCPDRSDLHQLG